MFKILCLLLTHLALIKTEYANNTNLISSESSKVHINYRLPKIARPIRYDLNLDIHLNEPRENNFTFDGEVKISLEVKNVTSYIVLHSKDLEISSLELKYDHNVIIPVSWNLEPVTDFLRITIENYKLIPNIFYTIEIKYRGRFFMGKLIPAVGSFYASSYLNKQGKPS